MSMGSGTRFCITIRAAAALRIPRNVRLATIVEIAARTRKMRRSKLGRGELKRKRRHRIQDFA
jgi:hypothetical protein